MTRDSTRTSGPDWNSLWLRARERLRRELGDGVFNAWLGQLSLLSCDRSELKIAAPRMYVRNWVASHYLARIERALRAEGFEPESLSIVLAPTAVGGALVPEAPLAEASVSRLPLKQPFAEAREQKGSLLRRELNATQTFETFVAGGGNGFAHAAAHAFACGETTDVPLLFFHGTFGVGKTHLLNAIALKARASGTRAVLLGSETFMCSFLGALRNRETLEFKDELRSAEMLLVDDLQHLCRSSFTVSEFLHTLNAFSERGRKFVIAADKAPGALDGLSAEVRSRLSGGLVIGIDRPDRETRLQILKVRSEAVTREMKRPPIPDVALQRLADIDDATPRDLIGMVSKLSVYAELTKNPAGTQQLITSILTDGAGPRKVSIDDIQRKAAEYYKLDLRDFVSKQRSRRVARPRQVAMYLSRQLTERSLPEIGRRFGGRDHTTVLHACRRIEELCDTDPLFRQEIEFLKDVLNKPS